MKLAFCLFRYFPYSGLSRVFLSLVNEMAARGHMVDTYVYEWQGEYPSNVSINLLPSGQLTNHNRDANYYKTVRPFLKHGKYDLVIGFNKMPELDFYFAGDFCYIDKVSDKYSDIYRLTPRHHHFSRFEKEVFGLQSKTLLLMLSESEKKIYQQNYGTSDSRFFILPPYLDRNQIITENQVETRERIRQQLKINDDEWLVLFVGSGFKIKGLDRAIQALASLPKALLDNAKLYVVGKDNEKNYKQLATQLKVSEKVIFMGGRSDVGELMQAGDCLLHPAYRETSGGVLLEAIASGLPVLTTDTCGYAPYIKKAQSGIVLDSPIKPHKLSEALETILTSKERQKWSENGREYGKNLASKRFPETVADIIENNAPEIILRKNNALTKLKTRYNLMLNQGYTAKDESNQLQQLFENPDKFIENHALDIIKNDKTTTVAVVECDHKLIVLKRFNTKGIWHFFKRSVRMTRASICWRYANRLIQCGLSTPRPIGFKENRFWQFRGRSYFVAEYSNGVTLLSYLQTSSNEKRLELVSTLMSRFFSIMEFQKLAHGDMKANNFLIKDDQLEVLDLDSMRSYHSKKLHKHKLLRDKRRFLRNWGDKNEIFDYIARRICSIEELEYIESKRDSDAFAFQE